MAASWQDRSGENTLNGQVSWRISLPHFLHHADGAMRKALPLVVPTVSSRRASRLAFLSRHAPPRLVSSRYVSLVLRHAQRLPLAGACRLTRMRMWSGLGAMWSLVELDLRLSCSVDERLPR